MPWDLSENLVDRVAVDVTDLPTGEPPDGTEVFACSQAGGGVQLALDQFAARPASAKCGLAGDRYRAFEDFDGFETAEADSGDWIVGTLGFTNLSGTGAQVSQWQGTTFQPGTAALNTGTDTTGHCAVMMAAPPLVLFDSTRRLVFAAGFQLQAVSTVAQEHECQIGMLSSWDGAPADGFIIRSQEGDTNWQAVVYTASVESAPVALATIGTSYVSVIGEYDPDTEQITITMYDDDAVLLDTTNLTDLPTANANIRPGAGIFKKAGTTNRRLDLDYLYCDVPALLRRIPRFS